jgi:hypothetical protein
MNLPRHAAPRRRLLIGALSLGALCLALPLAARAQATAASPPPPAYRRRKRDIGSLLLTGVVVIGGLFGWAAWSAKRKRQKEEAARDMQQRLARARERSKNL